RGRARVRTGLRVRRSGRRHRRPDPGRARRRGARRRYRRSRGSRRAALGDDRAHRSFPDVGRAPARLGAERVIPDPPAVGLFVLAALALLLVPGPAVLYVVARSIEHGRRAGIASVLGIHVGTLVHITAATLGLSALVLSSAVAFTAVKIAGAVYLVGLGLWTLFSRHAETDVALGGERNLRRAFAQGIVVN